MPSTKDHNILFENIVVQLEKCRYKIDIYDTPLGRRWLEALKDNLKNKKVLEKNFCWLGWAGSQRNLYHLVTELNKVVEQINNFKFDPPYEKIHPFVPDDFQYSSSLPICREIEGDCPGLKLKHEACNLLHRYFEELQGTAWELSPFYKQADTETKYAIRQLNNLCHEIEGWVESYRKSVVDPEWMRPSQITTFLNAPRFDLHDEDFELFKQNRFKRELGGVYLHWSQVGKTLFEVYRDEGGKKLDEATCSAINHQKFYSGEFDVEWGQTIDEDTFDWKKEEMDGFRSWLKNNDYDWDDPKLALGYIKLGQIDLSLAFADKPFLDVYDQMKDNLNIKSIHVTGTTTTECEYPYNLDDKDWKEIQMKNLRQGYESRSMR